MKVFIDPGHGGEDNGAAWGAKYDYVEEDDLNLIVSVLLQYELLLAGFETRLSRVTDRFLSLADRTEKANAWGADSYISIHADAFHNKTAKGISTHIYPHCSPDTKHLAVWIQNRMGFTRFTRTVMRRRKSKFWSILLKSRLSPAFRFRGISGASCSSSSCLISLYAIRNQ